MDKIDGNKPKSLSSGTAMANQNVQPAKHFRQSLFNQLNILPILHFNVKAFLTNEN